MLTKIKGTFITLMVLAALVAGGMYLTNGVNGRSMSEIVFIVHLDPTPSATVANVTWKVGSGRIGSAKFKSAWQQTEQAPHGTPVSMTALNPGGGKVGCEMIINGHSLYGDSVPKGSGSGCDITAFA